MPKNLLVADDSVTIQKVVGIVFAHEDYRVTAASSGEDALRMAHEQRPDVILVDAAMPGMDGYDLCAALKGDPRLADVPVLILAATSVPFDESRARTARADGHVVKPFDSQTLLSRVRELVEGVTPEPLPAAYPRTTPSAPSRPVSPATTPAPVAAVGGPPRRTVPPPLPPPGHPSRLAAARPPGLPVPSVRTAGVRPPPPGAARPVAAAPRPASIPPPAPRPPAPPRPAPPPARAAPPSAPFGLAAPGPADEDWSDLTSTPPAAHPPARAAAVAVATDGGETALRLALSQASREVVERIAWEVIPQLAEVIIREHVERLVNERQKR